MTAIDQKTLIEELNEARVDPRAVEGLSMLLAMLTIAALEIKDATTQYDYGRAIEIVLDGLDGGNSPEGYDFKGKPRPESSDERPLYQRLDDERPRLVQVIRHSWSALQLFQLSIHDLALRERFHDDVVKPFAEAMGIPSETEHAANPDAHPTVKNTLGGKPVPSPDVASDAYRIVK